MKTLSNLNLNNTFDEIVIGQVTICAPSTAVYKLTLPIDTGEAEEVLTTDGTGITSWKPKTGTGSVVLASGPTINTLTLTGTITQVNTILVMNDNQILFRGFGDAAHGIGYDGVVIDGPNLHGTSGGRLSQGTSDGTPRLTWTSDGVQIPDILRLVNPLHIIKSGAGEKDVMFIGESLSTNRCAVFKWNGNTNTEQNYFDIGFFGNSNKYRFRGDGKLTMDKLQFNNAVLNRTITLFEDADNDHQFSGFGINANVLRYQVGSTSHQHKFYAGTGIGASDELLSIKGNGDIIIPNGVLGMQLNEIRLVSDTNDDHGLVYDASVNGPNLHGFNGGRLSKGSGMGDRRLVWDGNGVHIQNGDLFLTNNHIKGVNTIEFGTTPFTYAEGTWTPDFTWLKGTLGVSTANYTPTFTATTNNATGQWIRNGKQITLSWDLDFTVTDVGVDGFVNNILFPCITGVGNVLPFRIRSGFKGANLFHTADWPNGYAGGIPAPVLPVYPEPYNLKLSGNGDTEEFFYLKASYGNWTSDGHRIPMTGTVSVYIITIAPPFYALLEQYGENLSNQWFANLTIRFKGSCTYFTD